MCLLTRWKFQIKYFCKNSEITLAVNVQFKIPALTRNIDILCYCDNQTIGQMSRVFAIGPGDRVSILGRVIPKTRKTVLNTALFNTQHSKVRIKRKVEQSREWHRAHPYTAV